MLTLAVSDSNAGPAGQTLEGEEPMQSQAMKAVTPMPTHPQMMARIRVRAAQTASKYLTLYKLINNGDQRLDVAIIVAYQYAAGYYGDDALRAAYNIADNACDEARLEAVRKTGPARTVCELSALIAEAVMSALRPVVDPTDAASFVRAIEMYRQIGVGE